RTSTSSRSNSPCSKASSKPSSRRRASADVPVHVSIHDVSPAWEREVDAALELAERFGAKPALLVVPDFHGRAPLREHPRYAERLRALEGDGHEIFLHGYYHRARGKDDPGRDGRNGGRGRLGYFVSQRIVSNGEAEFDDVS